MKYAIIVNIMLCLFSNFCFGVEINISENLVNNSGFEEGQSYWNNIIPPWTIQTNNGIDNSSCLFIDKPAQGGSTTVASSSFSLIPGKTYSLGTYIKTASLSLPGAGMCLEWRSKATGSWVGGYYPPKVSGSNDYRVLNSIFKAPANAGDYNYYISLYLPQETTGTAWYDQVYIRECQDSLLINGDFQEAGASWKYLDSDTRRIESNIGRSSSNALVIESTSSNSSYSKIVKNSNSIQLVPGEKYLLCGYIKTENVTGNGGSFTIEWRDAQTDTWCGEESIPDQSGTQDWTYFSKTITAPDNAGDYNYNIVAFMRSGSTGKMYFDDLYFLPEEKLSSLMNGDFEDTNLTWKSSAVNNWQIETGAGWNNSKALVIEPESNSGNIFCSSHRLYLRPDKTYVLNGMLRSESLVGTGGHMAWEWRKKSDGQWAGGKYFTKITGSNDWENVNYTFITPGNCNDYYYQVVLYTHSPTTGRIIFDNISLEALTVSKDIALIDPVPSRMPSDYGKMEFGVNTSYFEYLKNTSPIFRARLSVFDDSNLIESYTDIPVVSERINWNTPQLTYGNKQVKLQLYDSANNRILAGRDFTLEIHNPATVPVVSIDKQANFIVNNQKFVPVGIYARDLTTAVIDDIANAGFNCVLPYNSPYLSFTSIKNLNSIIEVLDYCNTKNLKVIFSLKDFLPLGMTSYSINSFWGMTDQDQMVSAIVDGLKNHPAILFWYASDETPVVYAEQLLDRRNLIDNIDNDHAVLNVFFQHEDFKTYAKCNDVFGIDPYPIRDINSNDMATVEDCVQVVINAIERANGTIASLAVPQIFNPGVYDDIAKTDLAVYTAQFKDPSPEEMRSIAIMETIGGAKGFLLYSYQTLFMGPDTQQYQRRWPEIIQLRQTISSMVPFISSENIAPAFTLNVISGKVYAKCFKDSSGNLMLLIAGIGPGLSKAEITFTDSSAFNLSSQFSKTVSGGTPGKYIFEGNDICSDILVTP